MDGVVAATWVYPADVYLLTRESNFIKEHLSYTKIDYARERKKGEHKTKGKEAT